MPPHEKSPNKFTNGKAQSMHFMAMGKLSCKRNKKSTNAQKCTETTGMHKKKAQLPAKAPQNTNAKQKMKLFCNKKRRNQPTMRNEEQIGEGEKA